MEYLCLYFIISNMNKNMGRLPPGRIKLFFWFILCFLSVFFAFYGFPHSIEHDINVIGREGITEK